MNVNKFGTTKRKLRKKNREDNKPLHERPHESHIHDEDHEDLSFGNTPFMSSATEE